MLIFAQLDLTGINGTKSSRQCQAYRTVFQSIFRSFPQKMAGTIITQGDKNKEKDSRDMFLINRKNSLSSLDHIETTFWVLFLTFHAHKKTIIINNLENFQGTYLNGENLPAPQSTEIMKSLESTQLQVEILTLLSKCVI